MAFFDDFNTIFDQYDFRMQDASGGAVNSGTGADFSEVTNGGGLTYSQTSPIAGDNAITFDGLAYLQNATQLFQQTATVGTICFVFKTSYSGGTQYFFTKNVPASSGRRFEFKISSTGFIQFRGYNTSGGTNFYRTIETVGGWNDGEWHIVVVRQKADGTGLEWFLDSAVPIIGTETLSGTFDADSWSNDVFGATSYTGDRSYFGIDGHNITSQFVGDIAAFGTTDVAESDANIEALLESSGLASNNPFGNKTKRRRNRRMFTDQF